jgi:hypothetical protein
MRIYGISYMKRKANSIIFFLRCSHFISFVIHHLLRVVLLSRTSVCLFVCICLSDVHLDSIWIWYLISRFIINWLNLEYVYIWIPICFILIFLKLSLLLPPFSFLRRTNELCRYQGKNQLHAFALNFCIVFTAGGLHDMQLGRVWAARFLLDY